MFVHSVLALLAWGAAGANGEAAVPSPADTLWEFAIGATRTAIEPSFQAVGDQLVTVGAALDQHRLTYNETAAALHSWLQQQQQAATDQLRRLETRLDAVAAACSAQQPAPPPPRDCSDLPAAAPSGVHVLHGVGPAAAAGVPALCDQQTDGGGWTVLQRRADIQPRRDFYLGWHLYKWGFGWLAGEFWWGLQHMWRLTAPLDRQYELRVDLEDFEGNRRHALYQGFRISPEEDGYRLTVTNYTGDAGDSLSRHSGHRFSTKDRDQDAHTTHCAQDYKGGWWYEKCHYSNLNGLYLAGNHSSYANGVNWYHWHGYYYSLKTIEMKIRPTLKL